MGELLMKNSSVIISTYTADVSGVCSALYELGGMVVIHDPSGCNSTYNTHDEPRWYDQDSLIFISGLSEIDAIMGSDDKLIDDVVRAARQLCPRFIALVQTPVPMMTGIDFYGIRDILKEKTGLPVYFFPTNGMHSYVQGVNMALAVVARDMVDEVSSMSKHIEYKAGEVRCSEKKHKVNLLGVTPLDFSVDSSLSSMKQVLCQSDFEVLSCFAMGSSLSDIARAGEADVNLVVSSAGIEAARALCERFSTPYVVGLPTGVFADVVTSDMRKSIRSRENILSYRDKKERAECRSPQNVALSHDTGFNHDSRIYIIGEAVAAQSIREEARMAYGLNLTVLVYLETPEELMDEQTIYLDSEEAIADALLDADAVIADPLYRPICPKDALFIAFPHEAFSGRIYRGQSGDGSPIDLLRRYQSENRPLIESENRPLIESRQEDVEKSIRSRRFHKKLFSRFAKAINTYDLLHPDDKVAVCISGGKDSMLMAKLFQEIKRHNKFHFDLEFLVMDPGYSKANREMIEYNASTLGVPISIFESDIFDSVFHIEQSPCYLCARMRRGHLYSQAKALGCNKIALGHHYDDVIETILMGMLYGAQIQTMMPKLHSTNFEGMELIRPMYLIREDDIKDWRDANHLEFLQCACRFTEQVAKEAPDKASGSKRLEIKRLIASLKETNPFVEGNIFKSVENVNLHTIIAYKKDGIRHHFLEDYDRS